MFSSCKKYLKDNKEYIIQQSVAIIMVCFLLLICCARDRSIHIRANGNERIEMRVREQSINDLSTDRMLRHKSKLVISSGPQKAANRKTSELMNLIIKTKNSPNHHQYHELHTNGKHQVSYIGRKIEKYGKANHAQNIAEISFGKSHYKNIGSKFQPYQHVFNSYDMANLTNKEFMHYDQSKFNVHRNNILNNKNKKAGIAVLYNRDLNLGFIVEEFS